MAVGYTITLIKRAALWGGTYYCDEMTPVIMETNSEGAVLWTHEYGVGNLEISFFSDVFIQDNGILTAQARLSSGGGQLLLVNYSSDGKVK